MMMMMLMMMNLMITMMMSWRKMRRWMGTTHPTSQIPGVGYTPTGGAPGPHGGVSRDKCWQTASSMPCSDPALFEIFVSDLNQPLDRHKMWPGLNFSTKGYGLV